MKINRSWILLPLLIWLVFSGCAAPRITLVTGDSVPLREVTLEGTEKEKVVVIPVRGKIDDNPKVGLFQEKPSMLQEFVAQLRKAEQDEQVRAILLKIDSPGGSVTASDLLYHEIAALKNRTGKKVVAVLMNVAASGGYYMALPADYIIAHPTTLTGSVGVIFLQPKVTGLMEKIGVGVDVSKSGKNKDMGSPFRQTTPDEKIMFQQLTDRLAKRFLDLVRKHRKLDKQALAEVATARIYLADEALDRKLVDQVGYLNDAVDKARNIAGLSPESRVVVYRRSEYPNDTVYNTRTSWEGGQGMSLVELDLPASMSDIQAGFYYLWPAAAGQ